VGATAPVLQRWLNVSSVVRTGFLGALARTDRRFGRDVAELSAMASVDARGGQECGTSSGGRGVGRLRGS
jgi:hypothetical protein